MVTKPAQGRRTWRSLPDDGEQPADPSDQASPGASYLASRLDTTKEVHMSDVPDLTVQEESGLYFEEVELIVDSLIDRIATETIIDSKVAYRFEAAAAAA